MPKYRCPKWFGAMGWSSDVRIVISGNAATTVLAAAGVQKRFDKIIDDSLTPCSFKTFTACKSWKSKLFGGFDAFEAELYVRIPEQQCCPSTWLDTLIGLVVWQYRLEIEHKLLWLHVFRHQTPPIFSQCESIGNNRAVPVPWPHQSEQWIHHSYRTGI